jgi:tripartite-type tricarboxylate transporter receptor subunit TctC
MKTTTIIRGLAAAALSCIATLASAEEWPERPVKLVMPFSAGGPGDVTARIFAEALEKSLKQRLLVENKPGAGGIIGADYVAKSQPNGYTVLLAGNGTVTNFLLRPKMPYQEQDLIPVAMTNTGPSVLVVNSSSGIRNLADLQAYARKQGYLTFADAGVGSTGHFVAEMARQALNMPVTLVHYKSGGEAITSVVSGQVVVASEAAVGVLPYIKSGKLTAIGVAADSRLFALQSVPTTAEQGFPSIQMRHWGGYFLPRGTPPEIVDRLRTAISAAVRDPRIRQTFMDFGYNTPDLSGPEFADFLNKEKLRLGKIVAAAGMTAN